ncbi:unnamed protein product [Phytophthora fragariaefolia]|uniref:Unnamed protein product n=1 Tax=Phytophthora fragariaefolia TaxID=1490495 RepID=A0A9W6U230_9STRA|nr:unnamed protein product [Phytophthora fragariaefolia]
MPARRVTRREAEVFLRRLEGREGADRERLVREHREYIDGTRDHDADFGDEEQKEDATSAPHTPTKRSRMTVRHQKKRALSTFYDMLAKTPALPGKMPVAALNAEELAEQAAIAELELDDDRDEDYDESAEAMPNDDAEYLEATTPPATPRSNPSPKRRKTKKAVPKQAAKATGKGKRKRAALTERSAVKRPRTECPHLSGIDSASRYVALYCRRGFIRANYLFVCLFLCSEASLDADFGTGSALTSPAGTPLQLAQQTAACSPTPTPHRTSTARTPTTSAPHDVEATKDEYALNSEDEDSDPGSAEWYQEMGELLPPGGTAVDSDGEYDSGDENAETAMANPSRRVARRHLKLAQGSRLLQVTCHHLQLRAAQQLLRKNKSARDGKLLSTIGLN